MWGPATVTVLLSTVSFAVVGVAHADPVENQAAALLCESLDEIPTVAELDEEVAELGNPDRTTHMSPAQIMNTIDLAFTQYCAKYKPLHGYWLDVIVNGPPEARAEIDLEGNLSSTPLYEWSTEQIARYD